MAKLKDIRKAVSLYPAFQNIATVQKLQEPRGTKTITEAKEVGIFLSRKAGHNEDDIAKTFGYSNGQSVLNVFRKATRDFQNNDRFKRASNDLAEKLDISLE